MVETKLQLYYFLRKFIWIGLLDNHMENLCKARAEWAQNFDIGKINMQLDFVSRDLSKSTSTVLPLLRKKLPVLKSCEISGSFPLNAVPSIMEGLDRKIAYQRAFPLYKHGNKELSVTILTYLKRRNISLQIPHLRF